MLRYLGFFIMKCLPKTFMHDAFYSFFGKLSIKTDIKKLPTDRWEVFSIFDKDQ